MAISNFFKESCIYYDIIMAIKSGMQINKSCMHYVSVEITEYDINKIVVCIITLLLLWR